MNSIKILIFTILLILNLISTHAIEYKCPRNSVNSTPFELKVEMKVYEVSNLQHQTFTVDLSGDVCNSTLSNTQVYTFGYGNGPNCNLGSLYYGLQLSGNLVMKNSNGDVIYNNNENAVTISKNPSNNYFIMKIYN